MISVVKRLQGKSSRVQGDNDSTEMSPSSNIRQVRRSALAQGCAARSVHRDPSVKEGSVRGKVQHGTYRMYFPYPTDQGKGCDELLVAEATKVPYLP